MAEHDDEIESQWMSFSYRFRIGLTIYCMWTIYMASRSPDQSWKDFKAWELMGKVFLAEFGVETIYRLYHWLKKS